MANTSDGGKGAPPDPSIATITTNEPCTDLPGVHQPKNVLFSSETDQVTADHNTLPTISDRTTTTDDTDATNTNNAGSTAATTTPPEFQDDSFPVPTPSVYHAKDDDQGIQHLDDGASNPDDKPTPLPNDIRPSVSNPITNTPDTLSTSIASNKNGDNHKSDR